MWDDMQDKYIQATGKLSEHMAENARNARKVAGLKEKVKSSKGKHKSNYTPPKKKRK